MSPPELICARMNEAESADVTRKMKISKSAAAESAPLNAMLSNMWNSAEVMSVCVAAASPALRFSSMSSAAPPKTPIHRQASRAGISRTPNTYCRIVRPREMRATKVPTDGDQAMTHAQ